MNERNRIVVELEPYSEADLPLLKRNNSPEMTAHLGGPESEEQINRRHQRYAVGMVGYWEKKWRDELVWEAGWGIVPAYQGRGLAGAAVAALIDTARAEKRHRFLHAFPSVDNPPSNALCRRLGFELIEACDFEYPSGHFMRCNDWRLDLSDENDYRFRKR